MKLDKNPSLVSDFAEAVRAHLKECVQSGVIEGFVCTIMTRMSFGGTLYNGNPHSKGPTQENRPFQLEVSLLLCGQKGVSFSVETLSFNLFIKQLEFSISNAVVLRHGMRFRKQKAYPCLSLISEELVHCFDSGKAVQEVQKILAETEKSASCVSHRLLMNREVSVSLSRTRREYFDSADNNAIEDSADCTVMVSYSLEDSGESHFDVFGRLPSSEEVHGIVLEASRNIIPTKVRPLDTDVQLPVLLTSKAIADLFEQIVLPNLESRTLLDKTGAWDFSQLDKTLLSGVSVEDNPHLEHSPFSAVFDFEGTPTEPVSVMSEGCLVNPLMTSSLLAEVESEYPQLTGRFKLTGHADGPSSTTHTNLFIRINRPSMPELSNMSYIKIQNLTGMSVDPITGQFALDADGAKVFVDGVLSYSTSLTLRGNFFEAVSNTDTSVGELSRHYNYWTPSLLTTALSCVSKELAQDFKDIE
ncbi:MAG: hypothetical protein RJB13_2 [Pseudomonadota bacterium]